MPKNTEPEAIKRLQRVKTIVFDFDGVFTDNSVYVDQNGIESVRCSRSDGVGLRRLDQIEVRYCILSSEKNPIVTVRGLKLGIEVLQGHDNKLPILLALAESQEISLEEIAYVGNDINDLSCLKSVGLPIAVSDAYPEVLDVAKFVTTRSGGRGAVREICDLLFSSRIQ
jgi:YrbI family 3-deoxy-D-manno-octulosonate 8-phosphate phosphatase